MYKYDKWAVERDIRSLRKRTANAPNRDFLEHAWFKEIKAIIIKRYSKIVLPNVELVVSDRTMSKSWCYVLENGKIFVYFKMFRNDEEAYLPYKEIREWLSLGHELAHLLYHLGAVKEGKTFGGLHFKKELQADYFGELFTREMKGYISPVDSKDVTDEVVNNVMCRMSQEYCNYYYRYSKFKIRK